MWQLYLPGQTLYGALYARFGELFPLSYLDVSVFKELARRWKPEIYSGFKKASKHEALADIYESIDELKYYREHFIVK